MKPYQSVLILSYYISTKEEIGLDEEKSYIFPFPTQHTVVSRPTAQCGKIGISAKIGVGGYMRDGLLYTFTQTHKSIVNSCTRGVFYTKINFISPDCPQPSTAL